jgi:quercetin dioxygenase-like cupin family protein
VKSRAYEIYRERGLRVGDVCTSWPGPHAENVNPRWSTRFESANSDGGGLSSMHRTLDGDVLVHHLTQDERLIDPSLLARHGRSARTLVKEGPLRLTIMGIAAGGVLPVHSTDDAVTVHLLDGEIEFSAAGQDYPLVAGDILVFAPGVEHSARSSKGGTFLLTVVHLDRASDVARAMP